MADNLTLPATSAVVASDDVGAGVQHQRCKVTWGPDGTGNDTNLATPLPVQITPQAALNGLTIYRLLSAASTNAQFVKASAGQLYGWSLVNSNAAVRYVKLYNKASAPTVGTDTPVMTFTLLGLGGITECIPLGLKFSAGLAIAITTGYADADTGSVGAGDVIAHLFFL